MGCYNPVVGARFSGVGNVWGVVAAIVVLLAQPTLTETREYQTLVGVTSNLVVADGKVLFAQPDGSLTALDVQTGEVRARLEGDYSGRLTVADGAVIRWGDYEVSVLDPKSLKERWKAKAAGWPGSRGSARAAPRSSPCRRRPCPASAAHRPGRSP